MSEFVFDRAGYCSLLGLADLPPVSAEGLRELHRAQCCAIPFENIEPFLGRPVPLDLCFLQEKFLRRGRGGYCFELNSYFGEVLRAAGFSARPLLGRVWMGRPVGGGRTHLVNIVRVGDRDWIADVGFGGPGILEPIPYEAGWEGEQADRRLRLVADPRWGLLYQDWFEGTWRTIYSLAEETVQEIDIRQGNHYCATHPDSVFVKNLYCSRPRRDGERATLLAQGPVEDLAGVLSEDFGISLAPADLAALMTRLHVTGATN